MRVACVACFVVCSQFKFGPVQKIQKKSMDFQWCLAGFGDLQLILIVFEGPLVGLCVGGWVVALEGGLMLAMAAGTT